MNQIINFKLGFETFLKTFTDVPNLLTAKQVLNTLSDANGLSIVPLSVEVYGLQIHPLLAAQVSLVVKAEFEFRNNVTGETGLKVKAEGSTIINSNGNLSDTIDQAFEDAIFLAKISAIRLAISEAERQAEILSALNRTSEVNF